VHAAEQIRKFKVQSKKYELEQSLNIMLRDAIISQLTYEHKKDNILKNLHLIEEAIDDPVKMKKLEQDLGIVAEPLKEVILMSEMSKQNPVEEQKKKEKEARLLIRKLNEDKRNREKQKAVKMEELSKK
jgi:hypothetical protein